MKRFGERLCRGVQRRVVLAEGLLEGIVEITVEVVVCREEATWGEAGHEIAKAGR